ncbi:salicylate hydroxylase [Xylariomycetidae sp. FL2044]|nr:salicylate hydroxylase [Xylariomycetidae sp. FL2044]
MAAERLQIAIIGGGLAGAVLANALVQIPHLHINVFESAPQFSERGAAVGLGRNAQQALQHIIPAARELLGRAGAVPMRSSRVMMGSGPQAGQFVCDVAGGESSPTTGAALVVHRASLLRELLHPLPREALHANKAVESMSTTTDSVEIRFRDGQVKKFDAVVGADGVFSTIRKHVVGPEEWTGTPSGFYDCRNLVPYEKAKNTLGKEFFEVDRQYGWAGDGAYFLHDVLDNGTMVQCIMSAVEKDSPPNRIRTLTRSYLEELLREWLDGPIASKMMDLLLDQPNPEGYSAWEHRRTSTYANGRNCIMGDAAHAMTPWQGAGAGQAIEDAMILGTLLGEISSSDEIEIAFAAFDAVRRPRCQQIIDSSRGTGQMLCGQDPDVGLDAHELKQALACRWDFIRSLDMKEHREEAIRLLRNMQDR